MKKKTRPETPVHAFYPFNQAGQRYAKGGVSFRTRAKAQKDCDHRNRANDEAGEEEDACGENWIVHTADERDMQERDRPFNASAPLTGRELSQSGCGGQFVHLFIDDKWSEWVAQKNGDVVILRFQPGGFHDPGETVKFAIDGYDVSPADCVKYVELFERGVVEGRRRQIVELKESFRETFGFLVDKGD